MCVRIQLVCPEDTFVITLCTPVISPVCLLLRVLWADSTRCCLHLSQVWGWLGCSLCCTTSATEEVFAQFILCTEQGQVNWCFRGNVSIKSLNSWVLWIKLVFMQLKKVSLQIQLFSNSSVISHSLLLNLWLVEWSFCPIFRGRKRLGWEAAMHRVEIWERRTWWIVWHFRGCCQKEDLINGLIQTVGKAALISVDKGSESQTV